MKKSDCKNCACLVEGEDGEWICEQLNEYIGTIQTCPESEND